MTNRNSLISLPISNTHACLTAEQTDTKLEDSEKRLAITQILKLIECNRDTFENFYYRDENGRIVNFDTAYDCLFEALLPTLMV